MAKQLLIVVQGASATGKSTLARKLSKDTGVKYLSKDMFKEMLYDNLGVPADRVVSTSYGKSATMALYAATDSFLNEKQSMIIESAFTPELAERDIAHLTNGRHVATLQLYCTASAERIMQRYNSRIISGERHAGHPDTPGEHDLAYFAQQAQKYAKLDIEDTITVDTDEFKNDAYDRLLNEIVRRMEES